MLRSIFKLRKVSQQLENSCGFSLLACGADPNSPCTCKVLLSECCGSGAATDDNAGYAGDWCGKPAVTGDAKVKQCKAAAKLCKGFTVKGPPGEQPVLDFVASEDVGKELANYGEAAGELPAHSMSIGYGWKRFAADMGFKLGDMYDKFSCSSEAATQARDEEMLGHVKLERLREDFIAVKGGKFQRGAAASVWGYDDANDAAKKDRGLAPTELWPSDHFPMHATLILNTMATVGRLNHGESSRNDWVERSATTSAAVRTRITRKLLHVLRRMTMKLRSMASGRNADRK